MNKSADELLLALLGITKESIDPKSDKRSLFNRMLLNVLNLTGSDYGFIGEVLYRDGAPRLKTYAITNISWNEETSDFYNKYESEGMEFTNLNTLFGYTLKTGEPVISNDPANDTRKGGLPHGHPALRHYLGIPIMGKEDRMIGMMGLANKPGGYEEEDIKYLEPIISVASTLITADRVREDRDMFSGRLEQFRGIIDSYAIVAVTDAKGNITYANDRFCEVSGYAREELLGKNHNILKSEYHPTEFFAGLWQTISSGNRWQGVIKNKTRQGGFYWAETFIVPFMDANGKPYEYFSISSDVTRLKEQDLELENFFRLSVDLLCIADMSGLLKKVSSSFTRLLGYSEKELLSIPFLSFVHPEDREKTMETIADLGTGKMTFNFENRWFTKSGEVLKLRWVAALNQENNLIYASASDVTQQAEAAQKLLESKLELEKARAKDTFLANMSHEIRTPLNAIAGFTDILQETPLDEQQKFHVEIISSALKNLNVIINDILDLSKLESGKIELEKAPFNLDHLLRQVVNIYHEKAKLKNIRLVLSQDSGIPKMLSGDEVRLSQILINLVSNALKFTDEGHVELRVDVLNRTEEGVMLTFSVKDTGIGISSDKLKVIFDRFTQAEDYTTRMYGGTGLGLNIVRSLVELHKGHLRVESEPWKGSTFAFEIYYPYASLLPESGNGSATSKAVPIISRDLVVLLVDDNQHNQLLAKIYLERNRCKVIIANNGKEAIKILKVRRVDLVVMDIQMPIMDGIQATEMIRNVLGLTIPIIGCSAHALSSERIKCLEAGMDEYITKPYQERDIVGVIAKVINQEKHTSFTQEQQPLIQADVKSVFKKWSDDYGDETMMKLLTVLREMLPELLQDLEKFNTVADLDDVAKVAHNICGSFGSLNLQSGFEMARELELYARNKSFSDARKKAVELVAYLKELMKQTDEIRSAS